MSKKRHKHEEHEEHVNHERWLVTYADMITLLMVLFIVLFAMGQTDLAKYKKLRHSLAVGFGGPDKMALLDGGQGINEGGASPAGLAPSEIAANTALNTLEKRASAWKVEKAKLDTAASALQESLKGTKASPLIADAQIKVSVSSRGLVITIESDAVLFDAGSAVIRPGGQMILDRVASQLVALPNQIAIEGHTDNQPISSAVFPSNWELSTARAASVLRSLIDRHGLPQARGIATGYADQRPVAKNNTVEGRARNRRVDIVVLASVSDPNVDSPDAIAAALAAKPTGEDAPVVVVTTAPPAESSSAEASAATTPGTTPSLEFTPIPEFSKPAVTAAPVSTAPASGEAPIVGVAPAAPQKTALQAIGPGAKVITTSAPLIDAQPAAAPVTAAPVTAAPVIAAGSASPSSESRSS